MIIIRDQSIEGFILKEIQDKLATIEREGIHMSDLLAPKKCFWQKTNPLPATKSEIIYWLSGKAHEQVFLHVSDLKHGEALLWNDAVWYTPDVFFNFPVEIKTTRRGFVPKEGKEAEQFSYYIKQLRYYCAMVGVKQGWLIVWFLILMDENRRNTAPDYFTYRVEFTDEELEDSRKELIEKNALLLEALEIKECSLLPDCEKWICYKEKKNMTSKPFCHTCNKDFQTDWGIEKHVNSKTGKGHDTVKAVYETVREPSCKYAELCKPDMVTEYNQWKEKHVTETEVIND